jgi:flagellar transcriptional activator FlhC
MARNKSILTEARQIERAVTLIHLGARLQVLESETDLSYERLLRLYKEVSGKSPSKGQLPFSTDWFMTWQPNIHASLYLNIHEYLNKVAALGSRPRAWSQCSASPAPGGWSSSSTTAC